MKQLPEASRAIVRHDAPQDDQGPGSPDSAYASEAHHLRELLASYEERAERLIDWEPERNREPGETFVDAAFKMGARLKRLMGSYRREAYDANQAAAKATEHADGLKHRIVQLEGLVQASTERAIDMVAPGDKAKATAMKLRSTLNDLEGAQGILDAQGIGRYHPATGRELSFVERMEYYMRRRSTVVEAEGETVDDEVAEADVVIIDMPGGES
jgi:hypothetical protein